VNFCQIQQSGKEATQATTSETAADDSTRTGLVVACLSNCPVIPCADGEHLQSGSPKPCDNMGKVHTITQADAVSWYGLIPVSSKRSVHMNISTSKAIAIAAIAFVGGVVAANLPPAVAAGTPQPDLSSQAFAVSIYEIAQNFVFGEEFVGSYTKSITLSDGSTREIELTPMIHNGIQVVRFKDTGGHTYMGLNGTTTNGSLMVQVREYDASLAALKEQGWQ